MRKDSYYKKRGFYARFPSVLEQFHLKFKKVKVKK